uniref:Retrotransposon gag domain-containing protein n=1 Tax=Hyaloperonospora arabidopsidis (strain Emoy2) TaxID=559515 RepID=M4BBL1_HYAAE
MLIGPARNNQLSRSTRHKWKRLLDCFMIQYGGQGVSVARQYYLAQMRSAETPLEYLHRLNEAAKNVKIAVKEEILPTSATRREHVEHFIATLEDRDLAKQLTPLRLMNVYEVEETLRACQRMENRQMKAPIGLNKFHRRTTASSNPMSSKAARAVRAVREKVESSGSGSDSTKSDEDVDRHRVACPRNMLEYFRPRWRRCYIWKLSSVKRVNDYARSPVRMELDIAQGNRAGIGSIILPENGSSKQKATGNINNKKATMLFDSGAEVLILDTTFALKPTEHYVCQTDTMYVWQTHEAINLNDQHVVIPVGKSTEIVYANRGQDRPGETIEDVKVTATEDIRYVVADPLRKRSSHQPDAISIEDGELQEQADQLVENYEKVRIDTSAEREKTVRSPAVNEAIDTMNEIDRVGNLPTPTDASRAESRTTSAMELIQSINSPAISQTGLRAKIHMEVLPEVDVSGANPVAQRSGLWLPNFERNSPI